MKPAPAPATTEKADPFCAKAAKDWVAETSQSGAAAATVGIRDPAIKTHEYK